MMLQFVKYFWKVAILSIALNVSVVANAQEKGDMAVGLNILGGYGNEIPEAGIGTKFLYNVTNPIRLSGEFDILWGVKSSSELGSLIPITTTINTKWKEFSVYGHYLFSIDDGSFLATPIVYPLVGLGIMNLDTSIEVLGYKVSKSSSESMSKVVLSLGGGMEGHFKKNDKLFYAVQARLKIVEEGTRVHVVVGIGYKF